MTAHRYPRTMALKCLRALMALVWIMLMMMTILLSGCGQVQTVTNDFDPDPSTSSDSDSSDLSVAVHVTDFFSTGILSVVSNLQDLDDLNVQTNILDPLPHTDALLRAFDGLLYIVNRLGRDSIQVVDPEQNFENISEFSTGQGSNPHDILALSSQKAYVTLYEPESQTTAEEILIVNPSNGATLGMIDLTPIIDDDGDQQVRPERMIQVGDEVWVLIQDLSSAFIADTNGKIAVINSTTDTLVDVDQTTAGIQAIELLGRNPSSLSYDTNGNRVFVSQTGVFQTDFSTDTSDDFGGIELVAAQNYVSQGIALDDADIGGYPWGIALVASDLAFTVAESKRVVAFDPGTLEVVDNNVYESPGTYLPEILYDGNGRLLVTERGDLSGQGAGIVIIDVDADFAVTGPVDVGGPPNSLAVLGVD